MRKIKIVTMILTLGLLFSYCNIQEEKNSKITFASCFPNCEKKDKKNFREDIVKALAIIGISSTNRISNPVVATTASSCNYTVGTSLYASSLVEATTTSKQVFFTISTVGNSATIQATVTVGQTVTIASTSTDLTSFTNGASLFGVYTGNTCPLGTITTNTGAAGLSSSGVGNTTTNRVFQATTAGSYSIVFTARINPTDLTVRIQ